MAARTIRTLQGDTVDLLALRACGDTAMTVAILESNPGLARLGPLLPAGLLVTVPETTPAKATPVTLW
jgi:phage tail protein X